MTPLITIGLVTDLHYAPMTVGNRYCSESLAKLKASIDVLQTHELDLVVCLGDVIDKSETAEEEITCIREVVDALSLLSIKEESICD